MALTGAIGQMPAPGCLTARTRGVVRPEPAIHLVSDAMDDLTGRIYRALDLPIPDEPEAPTPDPLFLSFGPAADRLGIETNAVKKLVEAGELPAIRLGRRFVIPVLALEAFAARIAGEVANAS